MKFDPKVRSLIISGSIAIATALLVSLFTSVNGKDLAAVFLITLASGFLIVYYLLEKLIYTKMRSLQDRLRLLAGRDMKQGGRSGDPVEALSEDLQVVIREHREEIERLRKLEAFRKDFVADVSHELKTPIFAAQGFVHTLLDGAVKEKGVRNKFLKKAAKSLDGLDMLVQDLLTLSQIETGQIKMHFERFDLYALTEEVFEQFKGKGNKKDIMLRIEGPVRKVTVYGDELRIGQVITNLVSNAMKHSVDGGEVIINFDAGSRSVVTSVKDFGEGIPVEHIHRVFERFYRVDKSRSREKGGTGLGLAIVKHILDGHNTKAEIDSEPGVGTTFRFELPREKEEEDDESGTHNTSTEE